MAENIVKEKSKSFALRTIKLYQYLCREKKEFVLSKQILRAGTSIGANVCEADCAMSKKEFIAKLNIALKEAAETEYWLELLCLSEYLAQREFESLYHECGEIKALLIAIIKKSDAKIKSAEA